MAALLELRGIHKKFPGVYALNDVDFTLEAGSVHALLGENGAGKSTLIKIIAGIYDFSGEYWIDGQKMEVHSPSESIAHGVGVIYQELNLCLNMTVGENIYFDRWADNKGIVINYNKMYDKTQDLLNELGFGINARETVGKLSTAQQQLVEIAKAISLNAKILVMDEPTSALSCSEIESLFVIIRKLKASGIGIIYVSHKLDEIFAISDKVTVLRDGRLIGSKLIHEIDAQGLISMMVGREIAESYPKTKNVIGDVVLQVENLTTAKLKDVSFSVRKGEIVGFSGLMGAGRTELAKAIFGFDEIESGRVLVEGKELKSHATWEAVKIGIGYVPEDRKNEGIFSYLSVAKNITVSAESELSNHEVLNDKQHYDAVAYGVEKLRIKTPSHEQFADKLSGGNQQKVIVCRWFIKKGIKVLIVDEPTRGIDVGAKREIYALLNEFAQQGMAILIMSSELPEVIGISDRIYVMANGRITGELPQSEATQESVMELAI